MINQAYDSAKTEKLIKMVNELTAGEDQLPQESANVTRGSDHSKPKTLRTFSSLSFVDFEQVFQVMENSLRVCWMKERFKNKCSKLTLKENT